MGRQCAARFRASAQEPRSGARKFEISIGGALTAIVGTEYVNPHGRTKSEYTRSATAGKPVSSRDVSHRRPGAGGDCAAGRRRPRGGRRTRGAWSGIPYDGDAFRAEPRGLEANELVSVGHQSVPRVRVWLPLLLRAVHA